MNPPLIVLYVAGALLVLALVVAFFASFGAATIRGAAEWLFSFCVYLFFEGPRDIVRERNTTERGMMLAVYLGVWAVWLALVGGAWWCASYVWGQL